MRSIAAQIQRDTRAIDRLAAEVARLKAVNARLVGAAHAVLNNFGPFEEKWLDADAGGGAYWSPVASMVDTNVMIALKAATEG